MQAPTMSTAAAPRVSVATAMAGRQPNTATREEKITVRDLNFYYANGFHALKSTSLPIYDKCVTAFIGPSGCGKTTLLRVLNRIYALYPGMRATGQVMFECQNIRDGALDPTILPAKIGIVFQTPTPFPLSIYDNIAFGVRLYERLAKAEMDERVEQSLRRAGLWEEVKDKLGNSGLGLSGGQQQRMCIARAIAVRPAVLLMDEATSALDPISTARIEELVDDLKKDYCIAMVTHNMQQAARVSDYTAFMYLGELVEFGDTNGIFTRPQQKRTEEYITGRFG